MRSLLLGVTLLPIAGCAGMEPFEYRNHREEGPPGGAFSGERGEFVIFRGDESDARDDDDSKQSADEVPEGR